MAEDTVDPKAASEALIHENVRQRAMETVSDANWAIAHALLGLNYNSERPANLAERAERKDNV